MRIGLVAILATSLLGCGSSQPTYSIPVCPDDGSACFCILSGFVICDHVCVNTSYDGGNCGACGKSCGDGLVCSAGQCGASCGQLTRCEDRCVYDGSPFDCGGCGIACDGTCTQGACVAFNIPYEPPCPGNEVMCSAQCVDITSDNNNCGGCDHSCFDDTCQNGTCGCGGTETMCDGECVDTTTDNNNCGGCDQPCFNDDCADGICS
jgi:hypothetical protein